MNRGQDRRILENQSGIAALVMIIFIILIMAIVTFQYFADSNQKHRGGALTFNSERALGIADSGIRFAKKCLSDNKTDPNCPCNGGGGDCNDWTGVTDFGLIPFGTSPEGFTVTFSNIAACSIDIKSIGESSTAEREVNSNFTRADQGTGGAISVNNPQSSNGPIAVNNVVTAQDLANNQDFVETTYTVPTGLGPDLVLVVVAGAEDAGTGDTVASSATFDGNAMTSVGSTSRGGGGTDVGVHMFRLAVTEGDSGTLRVDYPGNSRNRTLYAAVLSNAVNSTEDVQTNDVSGTSITDTVTPVTNDSIIISGVYSRTNANVSVTGTGHVKESGDNIPTGEADGAMGSVPVGVAAAATGIGYTSNNTKWVQVLAAYPRVDNRISMNYTVPGGIGSDLVLIVVAASETALPASDAQATAATFDGNSMTQVSSIFVDPTSLGGGLAMYRLSVNSGDSGAITVTFANDADDRMVHAMVLGGAADADPEALVELDDGSGSVSSISSNITTLTDDAIVVTGSMHGNNNTLNVFGLGTGHVSETTVVSRSSASAMGSLPVPTASTQSGIGWQPATSPTNRMALILAAFAPAIIPCP